MGPAPRPHRPPSPAEQGFNPETLLGCSCSICPLGKYRRETETWNPIPPETHPDDKILVVGDFPADQEAREGRPLIGASWHRVLEPILAYHGLSRSQVAITNTMLCQPPANDLALWLGRYVDRPNRKINRANKEALAKWRAKKAAWKKAAKAYALGVKRKVAADQLPPAPGPMPPPPELQALVPTPWDCCRPQVFAAARRTPYVLLLGSRAYNVLTGEKKPVTKVRGSFVERLSLPDGRMLRPKDGVGFHPALLSTPGATHLRLTPTVQPAYALRYPEWAPVIVRDIERWVRWLGNKLEWTTPEHHPQPSLAQIRLFFQQAREGRWPITTCDIETEMGHPHAAVWPVLRTIGFSNERANIVIPITSIDRTETIDGKPTHPEAPMSITGAYYTPDDAEAILREVYNFLRDPKVKKGGHNFGYFDVGVLLRFAEFRWSIPSRDSQALVQNYLDSILLSRTWSTEIPRSLYFVGTMLTDVPDWKAANDERNIATSPKSMGELMVYNGIDTTVNARIFPPLARAATERNQWAALELDHRVQAHARNMSRLGLRIDQDKRAEFEVEYAAKVARHKEEFADLAGVKINMASTQQVADLIFERWGTPAPILTESGEPSTEDAALRQIIVKKLLDGDRLKAIQVLRKFRTDSKRLGTVIKPLRLWNDYRKNSTADLTLEDAEAVIAAEEAAYGRKGGGLCGPDGRVHPHYNVHTPRTARISASGPNTQNIEKFLRALVIPEEGHLFVGDDFDQIELRLFAALAGVKSYLRVFQEGGDPHATTASLVYGETFDAAFRDCLCGKCAAKYAQDKLMRKLCSDCKNKGKGSKLYNNLRTFAKSFVYLVIYGGSAATAYENLSAAEDNNGNLLFPDMTFAEVDAAYRAWLKNAPEVGAYWASVMAHLKATSTAREPILGRVRDIPSQDRNEALNFAIQSAAAIIMGQALDRITARIPYDFDARTGLVVQVHDFAMVECLANDAPRIKDIVQEAMTMSIPQIPGILFTGTAEIATNMADA